MTKAPWFELSLVLCFIIGAFSTKTPDDPISSAGINYLSNWQTCSPVLSTFRNSNCIPAFVPGDIITDLQLNNIIEDPLYNLNFKNDSIWADNAFVYQTSLQLTPSEIITLEAGGSLLLVFDGVKMFSQITLNGQILGVTNDQFLRYSFPLTLQNQDQGQAHNLLFGKNVKDTHLLSVAFDLQANVSGRFMASTGGWDWAPYSNANRITEDTKARTFSYGIWKHVYLLQIHNTAISYVVPHVFYLGDYPTTPLVAHSHGPFKLSTRVHFYTPSEGVSGTLSISITGVNSTSALITLPKGEFNTTLDFIVDSSLIDLWWPAGVGDQALYDVLVRFEENSSKEAIQTSRTVGFRYIALVTGDDTNPDYVTSSQGKNGNSHDQPQMRFRVNGLPLWLRGANLIPMDELEGRYSDEAHAQLLLNAKTAGMNMIRVWGGGVFQSNFVYSVADSLGLLIYHDMQFAQEGHSPSVDPIQEQEFRHQVRRLSHHPSIAVWDGCNECSVILNTPTGIYATFVLATVVSEDRSRIVWPSCPSFGWDSGVNRLDSLPNGEELIPHVQQQGEPAFEVHGPYQHGTGFPAVNGGDSIDPFNPFLPNVFPREKISLSAPNVFISEFGSVGMSSFEAMSASLSSDHWALHGGSAKDTCGPSIWGDFDRVCQGGNVMAERNYPCDSLIFTYFGNNIDLDTVGESSFRGQLYLCMMAQALQLKGEIERQRSRNVYGTLIWQLEEIWSTGGWGSLEYGAANQTGIVLGGRWKPLHHFLNNFLFQDVFIACGVNSSSTGPINALSCFIRNSGNPEYSKYKLDIAFEAISLVDSSRDIIYSTALDLLPSGPDYIQWFDVPCPSINVTQTIIYSIAKVSGKATIAFNYNLLTVPSSLVLSNVRVDVAVKAVVEGKINDKGEVASAIVYLANSGPGLALYVWLSTQASGYFSDNAFVLAPTPVEYYVIQFNFVGEANIDLLRSTLKVTHLAEYLI